MPLADYLLFLGVQEGLILTQPVIRRGDLGGKKYNVILAASHTGSLAEREI